MKLKNLAGNINNRITKFINYINSLNFDDYKYNGKYIDINDNGFLINCFKPEMEEKIKDTIINIVKKYWKDFESGIDLHRYDGDYFIEIIPESENKYNFIIESLDDDFYCKFSSDFIVNL